MNNHSPSNLIAQNKKARHDYFIEETLEAGVVLEGWEVKSLRASQCQIVDSYIVLKKNEVWWIGGRMTPLLTASTHINPDPQRTRKLLLHNAEIKKLIGKIEQKGYTLVPLSIYWVRGRAKLDIGLAKGKKQYDKRATLKEQDWAREKQRLMKIAR